MITQPLAHVKKEPHEEEISATSDPTGMCVPVWILHNVYQHQSKIHGLDPE